MTHGAPPAGWYPDPGRQHEHRYFDGAHWTEHVATQGRRGVAPLAPPPSAVGGLLETPVLVVNQKAKLFELQNEYAILDGDGTPIGAVRQIGQSAARKALRLLSNYDQFMTHRLEIVDTSGAAVLSLTRPAKWLKSRVVVHRPDGTEVGQIRQQNVFGKVRFGLEAGGESVGSINAENWRAWDFNIKDRAEVEVARVTKRFEGLAKAAFTTADNYVVRIHRPLEEPLRSLVVASALCIDTALKQHEGG